MSAPKSAHLPFRKGAEAARRAAGEALDGVGGAVLGAFGDGAIQAGEHRGELGGPVNRGDAASVPPVSTRLIAAGHSHSL